MSPKIDPAEMPENAVRDIPGIDHWSSGADTVYDLHDQSCPLRWRFRAGTDKAVNFVVYEWDESNHRYLALGEPRKSIVAKRILVRVAP